MLRKETDTFWVCVKCYLSIYPNILKGRVPAWHKREHAVWVYLYEVWNRQTNPPYKSQNSVPWGIVNGRAEGLLGTGHAICLGAGYIRVFSLKNSSNCRFVTYTLHVLK